MLSDITKAFEERNPSVASFETFAAECMQAISQDSANASLYLMLGLTAKQFCDRFADQPLTVETASERKNRILVLAHDAVSALGASADNKYDVLNRIAVTAANAAG